MDTTQIKTIPLVLNHERNQPRGQRRDVEWTTAKEFVDEASGLAVRVNVLALQRPKYDLVPGAIDSKKGFVRYLRPTTKIENGVVTVAHQGMVMARLLDTAYQFVQEALQAAEDKFFERKQERELEQIKRQAGTVDVPKTGKTAREVEKRARHEHNLTARRSADQERTSNSKSGRTR